MGVNSDFYAIIPAGGAGTRLWPLSRSTAPKFLLDLTGSGSSLLQDTVERLTALCGENFLVVTGRAHLAKVEKQLPFLGKQSFIAEPSGKNSMAAIGLAAAVLAKRHGDIVVGSFAADHVIGDNVAFTNAVESAIRAARAGYVATIGITPEYAATGFGYIASGEMLSGEKLGTDLPCAVYAVKSFQEKPPLALAKQYLESGEYFWNAGMFVAKASVLLAALERFVPQLYVDLMELAAAWDTENEAAVLAQKWENLPAIAIDHAIAEPLAALGGVAVVPAQMGWSDLGDYQALADLRAQVSDLPRGDKDITDVLDPVFVRATPGLVFSKKQKVVVLGIPDAVVVVEDDVVLVTTQEYAQEVKEVVEQLPVSLK